MKYISNGEWFDKGTEAILIDDYRNEVNGYNAGLFSGTRDGSEDEEICSFDEFEEINEILP